MAVATGGLSVIVIGLELATPIHVTNPSGRAALETLIALSAIFTARLLVANFQDSGRLPDLMLLCALVAVSLTDFAYCAAPALADGVRPEAGGGARLCCSLIVSVAFAAAAFAPDKVIRYPGRRAVGGAILAERRRRHAFPAHRAGHRLALERNVAGCRHPRRDPASGRAHGRTCGGGLAGRVGARVPPPRSSGRNPPWTPRSGSVSPGRRSAAVSRATRSGHGLDHPARGLRGSPPMPRCWEARTGSTCCGGALERLQRSRQNVSGSPATCTTGSRRIWRASPHKGSDSALNWNLGIL